MKNFKRGLAWLCLLALLATIFPAMPAAHAAPGSILSAPQNLSVTAATSYSVTLSWEAPATTYGDGNVTYNVTWVKANGDIVEKDGITTTSFECKYLQADTQYDFKVYAVQDGTVSLPVKTSAWTYAPDGVDDFSIDPAHWVVWGFSPAPIVGDDVLNVPGSAGGMDYELPSAITGTGEISYRVKFAGTSLSAANNGTFILLKDGTNTIKVKPTGTAGIKNTVVVSTGAYNVQTNPSANYTVTADDWLLFRFFFNTAAKTYSATVTNETTGVTTVLQEDRGGALSKIDKLSIQNGSGCSAFQMKDLALSFKTNDQSSNVPANDGIVITGVTVTARGGETSVDVNGRLNLAAAVTPECAWDSEVTWSSSDPAKATVDENGRVTGVASGSVVITATSRKTNTVSGTFNVTVSSGAEVIDNKEAVGEWLDGTLALSAVDGTSGEVEWSANPTDWVAFTPDMNGHNVTVTALKDGIPADGLKITAATAASADTVTLKYIRTPAQTRTHMQNGGFESDISANDWIFTQAAGTAQLTYDTADKSEGSRSAKVSLNSGRASLLNHIPVSRSSAPSDEQYKISFWYKTNLTQFGVNYCDLYLMPEDENKIISGKSELQVRAGGLAKTNGEWKYYETKAWPGTHDNKPYLGFLIRFGNGTYTMSGDFWIDDVRITPLKEDVPVTAIAITGPDTVANGKTLQLGAVFTPPESFHTSPLFDAVWSVTNETGSAMISPAGLLTAQSSGTVTVKAAWAYDENVFAVKTVTIEQKRLELSVDEEIAANGGQLKLNTGEGRLLKGLGLNGVEFSIESGTSVELVTSPTSKKATLIAKEPGTATIKAVYAEESLQKAFTVEVIQAVHDEYDQARREIRASFVPWMYDAADPVVAKVIDEVKKTAQAIWRGDADSTYQGMRNTDPDGGKRWGPTNSDRPWNIGDINGSASFWDDSSLYDYSKWMTQAFLYQETGESKNGENLYMNPDLLDDIISTMDWTLENIFTGGTLSGGVYQSDGVYTDTNIPKYPLKRPVSAGSSSSVYSNWFHRDIAMPKWSQHELMMLYDWVPASFVKEYTDRVRVYTGTSRARVTQSNTENLNSFTGGNEGAGNFADRALVMMYHGILTKNSARIQQSAAEMISDRVITPPGNNMSNGNKYDGSYIEHQYFPYAMGYGKAMLGGIGEVLSYVSGKTFSGTKITTNTDIMTRLEGVVENVFVPLYFHGVSMDNAAGRGIAAGPDNELNRAAPNMEAIYRVAVGSNEPARSRMLGNIKAWLIDRPVLQTPANLVMADQYAGLLADESIEPAERTGLYARNWESRTYWNTGGFMFSISQNNANAGNGMFEASNANSGSYQENRKNIHSGDGMTYLYTADDPEIYQGDFWATVDYRRLPGTTQEWKSDTIMHNAAARNSKNIAGTGVLRDTEGEYAASMFKQDLSGWAKHAQNTKANKSWFMLGDKIIALGSGITQTDGMNQVETIADQRKLGKTSANTVVFNGSAVTAAPAAGVSTGSDTAGSYVWVQNTQGTGDSRNDITTTANGVGYYFAPGQSLSVGKASQDGTWFDATNAPVNDKTIKTDWYASMFLNHGVNPENGKYEYVILPNRTQTETASYTPDYTIVELSDRVHAVYDNTLKVLAINNFADSSATVKSPGTNIEYTVNRSAVVIIREYDDGTAQIAVQDPNGASSNVVVTIKDRQLSETLSKDSSIATAQSDSDVTMTVSGLPSPESKKYNTWQARIKTVTETNIPTVTSVIVTPSTETVQVGGTGTFSATVEGEHDPAQTVAWSVSGNNSSGTAISSSGVLTVAADETAASLTVTATSTVDTTKAGTATVTVTAAPPVFVPVTGIIGVPTTATAGLPLTLTGTVAPANATNQTIVWSVQDAGTTGATIVGDTLSTTGAGIVIVTATVTNGLTESTNYTQDFSITVNEAVPDFVPVTGIIGVPTTATAGLPLTLTGTVAPANATNQTIVWSVKDAGTTGATIVGDTLSTTGAGIVIVTATVTNGLTESTNYTQDFSITVNAPVATYTVTFNNNGSEYARKTVNGGESIGNTEWPANPMRDGYTFGGWFTGENGAGTQLTSATTVNAAMTVYAKWTYISGEGGNGGSNGGGNSSTPYSANVKTGNGSATTLPVTVNKGAGTASVDLGTQNLNPGGTVITIPSIPDVGTYSVSIPVPKLSTTGEQGTLTLDTDNGSIIIPLNMLTSVSGISGNKAEISIGQGDKSTLSDNIKAAIGDRPLVQLTLLIDGKQTGWSNADAPVTVSIPYTPAAEELGHPESIVVWYIDGSGNVVTIPNGHYDPATGRIAFTSTHFSCYAVAYNKVSFNDVALGTWYHKAVSFIAARSITGGTGNGNYSPDAKLTRGDFLVMLMKSYDIAADTNPADNFSDAGNTYFTGYLAAAKRLGISSGVGNNRFAPEKEITRQEMFTLLYHVLKATEKLSQGNSGKALSDFTDNGQVHSWAEEAITVLVKTGVIVGNNEMLTPTSTATRAEMAQVLYNLLSK